MKVIKIILLFAIIIISNPKLSKSQFKFTAGDPTKNGKLEFKLVNPNGGADQPVVVNILGTDNPNQKAIKIEAAVNAIGGGWGAGRPGNQNTVTFSNKVTGTNGAPDVVKPVMQIKDLKDNTGEEETLGSIFRSGIFDFGMANVISSGIDPTGNPSLLSIATTSGNYSTLIPANINSASLIDSIFFNLQSNGVNVSRTSAYTIRIVDTASNPFLTYQVTDTSIGIDGTGGFSTRIRLNITFIMEGFYNFMNTLNRTDIVSSILRSTSFPYSKVDSAIAVIDSVTFTGHFTFDSASNGTYYLVVKHRNSIETWSKVGIFLETNFIASYDFTTDSAKAFGNNMVLKGTEYCVFSGDVNQDGIVDGGDKNNINNASRIGASGYLPEDVTGDNFVDGADKNIANNNSRRGVVSVTPLTSP